MALSGEIGQEKPNPAIFNTLLKRFRVKSRQQILHIGNDLETDYNAAKKFGAAACLIEDSSLQRSEKTKEEKCELINEISQLQLAI